MKTRIVLLLVVVAVITLSFTFAGVNKPLNSEISNNKAVSTATTEPIGGLFADQVVE